MTVVLDANMAIALVLREPQAERVSDLLESWDEQETPLHAPALAYYEIANALTRSRARGALTDEDVREAWAIINGLDITLHPPSDGERTVQIAIELERHSAFDAAYLALAERLEAELWTLDGPLARNARGRAYRVQLID